MKHTKYIIITLLGISISTRAQGQGSGTNDAKPLELGASINTIFGEESAVKLGFGLTASKQIAKPLNVGLGLNWMQLSTNEYERQTNTTNLFTTGYSTVGTHHILKTINYLQLEPMIEYSIFKNRLQIQFKYGLSRVIGSSSNVFKSTNGRQSFQEPGIDFSYNELSGETVNDLSGIRRWQHYAGAGLSYNITDRIKLHANYNFGFRDMVSPVISGEDINRFNFWNFGINYKFLK